MIQSAEDAPRVNAAREAYRNALENKGKTFVMYTDDGTRHAFLQQFSTALQ